MLTFVLIILKSNGTLAKRRGNLSGRLSQMNKLDYFRYVKDLQNVILVGWRSMTTHQLDSSTPAKTQYQSLESDKTFWGGHQL